MRERILEMRDLLQRAKNLDAGFDVWQTEPARIDQAMVDYAALKEELSQRMAAFNRLKFEGITPWFEAAYDAGIRHAHQAMIARSNASPKNPKWHIAVQAVQNELSYYLAKLEKAET